MRTRRLALRAFDHRADLLAALVYGCLAYLSFNALADYANAHTIAKGGGHLFPHPQGGWAFAVAIDGAVLYAFISFKRAPWLAGTLLVSGAAATYTLQRWHAQGALHPLMVAGVVPGLMVLVTFAWHRIRGADIPTPLGHPLRDPDDVPEVPVADPPASAPNGPAPLDPPAEPDPQSRPRVAQGAPRRERTATLGRPTAEVAQRAAQGHSANQIAKSLGLSDRARKGWVGDLVREHRPTPAQMGHPNGDGGSRAQGEP